MKKEMESTIASVYGKGPSSSKACLQVLRTVQVISRNLTDCTRSCDFNNFPLTNEIVTVPDWCHNWTKKGLCASECIVRAC